MPEFHATSRDLLHAVNLRHGASGFTSLPKEGVVRMFFALKNPTASAGFETAILGAKSQHATSRPPKPLFRGVNLPTHLYLSPRIKMCGSIYLLPFCAFVVWTG